MSITTIEKEALLSILAHISPDWEWADYFREAIENDRLSEEYMAELSLILTDAVGAVDVKIKEQMRERTGRLLANIRSQEKSDHRKEKEEMESIFTDIIF